MLLFLLIVYTNVFIRDPSTISKFSLLRRHPHCGAISAFEESLQSLKHLQIALEDEGVYVGEIIDKGLEKLEEYYVLTTNIPAYCFALSCSITCKLKRL